MREARDPPSAPPEDGDESAAAAIARSVEAGTDGIAVPPELVEEPAAPPASGAPAKPAGTLYAQITAMGMAAKIKLALRGNRDARMILIHDRSKLVRRLVLQNARITDGEVLAVARNRNVEEELLQAVFERREWMQNYQIRLAIVVHPKTPFATAQKHLATVAERDLRQIAKSKDVPGAVAAQARRILFSRVPSSR
jgi:hypothetical protein